MASKSEEYLLDSMFLVGYVLEGDPVAKDAENLFRQIERGQLNACASVVSLQETAYVLKKEGRSREQVRDALRMLLSIPHLRFLPLMAETIDSALDYMSAHSLTLGDVLIATTASSIGATLLTRDEVLLGLPFVRTAQSV